MVRMPVRCPRCHTDQGHCQLNEKSPIPPDFVVTPSYFLCFRHCFWALGSRCAIMGHFLHALPLR
jgi:hypothetical protein